MGTTSVSQLSQEELSNGWRQTALWSPYPSLSSSPSPSPSLSLLRCFCLFVLAINLCCFFDWWLIQTLTFAIDSRRRSRAEETAEEFKRQANVLLTIYYILYTIYTPMLKNALTADGTLQYPTKLKPSKCWRSAKNFIYKGKREVGEDCRSEHDYTCKQ